MAFSRHCETSQGFVDSSTADPALLVLVLVPRRGEGFQALLGVEIQVDAGVQEAEQKDHSVQSLHHNTIIIITF